VFEQEDGARWPRRRLAFHRAQRERECEKSAEPKYWLSLVHRVHETTDGFEGLAEPEKLYYVVSCLIGEVYNGGFDQFFSNGSGSVYRHALTGSLDGGRGVSGAARSGERSLVWRRAGTCRPNATHSLDAHRPGMTSLRRRNRAEIPSRSAFPALRGAVASRRACRSGNVGEPWGKVV